ncbi:MAG: hypothetical protein GX666_05295 [Tissierellia bacterium]|jgi:hypothetical protein|nr:hypothetical protein HMPREF0982_02763 [Erysipelotrichaceae bacterium 21_3]MCX4248886.1 hypothetical protein [Bacilli bacterium]MDD4714707.1 hypothetical protein [Candidatus Absconditabacteria bacterium]NLD16985.1 hypothetical protein [Tissierellia bacterium]DAQ71510.1 MAG TPA: tail assembly chaperone protein [Caudoviricetes sp.]
METDRVSKIKVGDKEYELILTTKATKEIAGRYGGLENLGDKLMKAENFEMALGEIVWLICLLANQSILIHNIKNKDNQKELLTEEEVEVLTTPFDLADYKQAITDCLYKGTKRNIESEENSKNVEVE